MSLWPPRPRCAHCGGKIRRESDGIWVDINGAAVGWHFECAENDEELVAVVTDFNIESLAKNAGVLKEIFATIAKRGPGRVSRL